MSYKFVKISKFSKDYLNYYYSKNPGIKSKSYSDQYNNLMRDCFAWANFFQINFEKIGVEAWEIVANAIPLQQAWASENNTDKNGLELLTFQLEAFKPDIIFIQDSQSFEVKWIKYLRERIPGLKKIIGWICSPFSDEILDLYKHFDFTITCSPLFYKNLNRKGLKSYNINHAFEASILKKIPSIINQQKDIVFIGSLLAGKDFHDLRLSIIEDLLKSNVKLEVYSNLIYESPVNLIKKKSSYLFTKLAQSLRIKRLLNMHKIQEITVLKELPKNIKYSEKLRNLVKEPVYGLDMYKILANSKMSLNIHGGVAGDYAANRRLYEATGVGSCLITDMKKNLGEFFKIDSEIISFSSTEECIEKVKWLLDHPGEREKIAKAGQARTLKDHTMEIRIKKLDDIIKKELSKV
jgi:spore maturation protein CgeB